MFTHALPMETTIADVAIRLKRKLQRLRVVVTRAIYFTADGYILLLQFLPSVLLFYNTFFAIRVLETFAFHSTRC